MLRSVLIPLDSSPASDSALEIALHLAKEQLQKNTGEQRPVLFTGVAVIDRPTITRQAVPVGAGAIKAERDEALLADAREKAMQALARFEQRCRDEQVKYESICCEGLPEEKIESASRVHDLIIIGQDTNFHFETSDSHGDTVKWLLHRNPRPLIVAPEQLPTGQCIAMAYDGSAKSAHAIHMWTLLDRRKDRLDIHVISVDRDRHRAQGLCDEAAVFLKHHDVDAQLTPIQTQGKVADALLEAVQPLDPQLIVMGAFGHSGLREKIFGSVTQRVLSECPLPLFLCQ